MTMTTPPRPDKRRVERLLGRWKGRLATDLTSKDVEDFKAKLAETLTATRTRRLSADEMTRPRERRPLAVATVNHHLKLLIESCVNNGKAYRIHGRSDA
jgi:hypothetical protein